jgi:hypothetical protein
VIPSNFTDRRSHRSPAGRPRWGRGGWAVAAAAGAVVLAIGAVLVIAEDRSPPTAVPRTSLPCSFWDAIGDSPTQAELERSAREDSVVVLNAWETDAMRTLKSLNPQIVVLVYKDLSSTRSYEVEDLGQGDVSAAGLHYSDVAGDRPDWFARDTSGRRIEWDPYPGHWQMAVWDGDYQQAWAQAVTREVVSAGWDGVLADNDFARLRFYSSAVVAGTDDRDATDELIRSGLDRLVTVAGERLQAEGKLFVPNVSEARLHPGRWEEHSRFGGAMEENFGYFADTDQLVGGADWVAQTEQLTDPTRLSLAITRTRTGAEREQRYGFASAAVRGEGPACWMLSTTTTYTERARSPEQHIPLGAPLGPGTESGNGVWTREFENGWVAVNPTDEDLPVVAPTWAYPNVHSDGSIFLPSQDALVLER